LHGVPETGQYTSTLLVAPSWSISVDSSPIATEYATATMANIISSAINGISLFLINYKSEKIPYKHYSNEK
jgi:hypothetical protein